MHAESDMQDYFGSDDGPSAHSAFAVNEDTAGQRLDRFLATHLSDISRTHVQNLIDEGRVLVDGSVKKSSHRLEAGETVTVNIPPPLLPGVEAENIPLDIIYE